MRGSSTNLVSGNQKAGRRLILGRCAISGGYGQSFNANTRSFGNFIARLWLLLIGLFGLRGTFTIRYIHFLLTLREYRRVSILLFYTGGSPVSQISAMSFMCAVLSEKKSPPSHHLSSPEPQHGTNCRICPDNTPPKVRILQS